MAEERELEFRAAEAEERARELAEVEGLGLTRSAGQ